MRKNLLKNLTKHVRNAFLELEGGKERINVFIVVINDEENACISR